MVSLGLPDDAIIEKIRSVTAIDFDTSVPGLRALKAGSVSDSVIRVMISPSSGNNHALTPDKPGVAVRGEAVSPAEPQGSAPPTEVGVYLVHNDKLTEVQPEIVNWQTGGVLKSTATLGIVKGDKNGKVLGAKSRTQTSIPMEFLIKTLEGTSVEEYQLLRLHKKSNRREFRSVTGGILHVSGGAQRDEVAFQPEKIGSRIWKVVIRDLPMGEYGFLPPGVDSASISSSGKIYTFEVAEEAITQTSTNVSEPRDAAQEPAVNSETPHLLSAVEVTIGASSDENPTIRHDGITISRVVAGGPADLAGMRAGDVVLAIDGHYLYTGQEMAEEVLRHKPGTKMAIRYRRYRTIYEASVVMGAEQ
ncbi:MAG: PDZ domain-containing protein [Terriglobales bacterium]